MKTTVGVIDYGAGNVFSVETMLKRIGVVYRVSNRPSDLTDVTHLILPGVGSFASAMGSLVRHGFSDFLQDSINSREKKLMGICLGMQLLVQFGEEGGKTTGLGIVSGRVERIRPTVEVRIPHIGWNELIHLGDPPELFQDILGTHTVYFNHSYSVILDEGLPSVYTEYGGVNLLAAFQKGNVFGLQFHPEKSQQIGELLFRRFLGR